ncbi:hypothetical protein TL16_g10226 [Triparma laevis f. inornata]|uniref:Uncharacterized protein n=1 Tax=Triparma laevis f. inornata TaxID=1714386 RepID=A0A9W7B7T5_9STRA|nr:hypothetical protein TL16_g10226 [Triparma laevis f. inornata]
MRFVWRDRHPDLSTAHSKNVVYDAIYISVHLTSTHDSLATTALFEQLTSSSQPLTNHIFYSTIGLPPKRALCQSPKVSRASSS